MASLSALPASVIRPGLVLQHELHRPQLTPTLGQRHFQYLLRAALQHLRPLEGRRAGLLGALWACYAAEQHMNTPHPTCCRSI